MKRKNYISWDEYFMGVADLSSKRSKDETSQVGACIVNEKNHIVGIGYNGFPIGCSDDELPWEREGTFLQTKYAYVVHAEANAILNANAKLDDSRIFVTLFPCNECAKLIIQSGIKEVIYLEDKYPDMDMTKASKKLFDMAGIGYRQIKQYNVRINNEKTD
jgi:dCMP deaminase